jgi:tRNA uridine 5-carbamoylmethylation protein Kti12
MEKQYMRNILIVTAGLPGTGKSYAMRRLRAVLDKKGIDVLYFDSDLFAKQFYDSHPGLDLLDDAEQKKVRLKVHADKLQRILAMFEIGKPDHHALDSVYVVLIDTCFDFTESREMFYSFSRDHGIILWVVELQCSESVVKKRILEHSHECERMIGDNTSRYEAYKKMRGWWEPVVYPRHVVIDSEGDVDVQLRDFVEHNLVC